MVKLCRKCGKLFNAVVSSTKYCTKCRATVTYYPVKGEHRKICKQCGKPFKTHQSRAEFCSDNCRRDFHYNPKTIQKICPWCKQPFTCSTSRQIYCSHSCYYQHKLSIGDQKRGSPKTGSEQS